MSLILRISAFVLIGLSLLAVPGRADAYSAEQVARLRGVGPATLESLFAHSPPAAIVAGFGPFRFKWNPPMDAALIDYAQRSGFVRVADHWTINGYRNGQVWVRQAPP